MKSTKRLFNNDMTKVKINGTEDKVDIAFVTDAAAVQSVVEAVVNTCRGELQLDKTAGIPWLENVLGSRNHSDDLAEWSGYMQNAILNTNGVTGLSGFDYEIVSLGNHRRGLTYSATIETNYGEVKVSNDKMTPTYLVSFVDSLDNNSVISTQMVEFGCAATPPAHPTHEGYISYGWDKNYLYITDTTVITTKYIATA